MKRTKIVDILNNSKIDENMLVMGWVRTKRISKNVCFITLNDGSCLENLQIVIDVTSEIDELLSHIHTGAALKVYGVTVKSPGQQQSVELLCKEIEILGEADPNEYPLQPKRHSLEFLRENAHLRFRTNTFGAVFRIRHAMTFAIHKFFNDKGFYNIHTPIITGSDCEGAGEMFRVTTLDMYNLPKNEQGLIDFTQDFFGKETNLTVSGQLEAELGALALSEVYTFGPLLEQKTQILLVICPNFG